MIGPDASEEEAPMAHDEETEPEAPPAPGHLIDGTLDSSLEAGATDPSNARPIASPFQIAPPADRPTEPIEAPAAADVDSSEPEARPSSGRSKGLIAAAVAGILVIGGAVAATVGGGSGKTQGKALSPTAGLAGEQISSDGIYISGATNSSPWVWQTGQSTAKSPGAPTTSSSAPGIPTPTSSIPTAPGSTQPSGPAPHSTSAPNLPPGSVPPPSSASAPPAPPPSAPVPTVSLVAGPGCQAPASGGGYAAAGGASSSGWGGNGSGGWGSDGCNGSMQSMPMTGDANNGPNRALWSFGSGTAGFATCVVSVYVPWDGKATDTGGTAAEYQLSEGSADTVVATYTVDQNTTHGQWVTLGTVNVGGNTVKLRLLDHGIDYPAGWRYGVAAAKLQCTR